MSEREKDKHTYLIHSQRHTYAVLFHQHGAVARERLSHSLTVSVSVSLSFVRACVSLCNSSQAHPTPLPPPDQVTSFPDVPLPLLWCRHESTQSASQSVNESVSRFLLFFLLLTLLHFTGTLTHPRRPFLRLSLLFVFLAQLILGPNLLKSAAAAYSSSFLFLSLFLTSAFLAPSSVIFFCAVYCPTFEPLLSRSLPPQRERGN